VSDIDKGMTVKLGMNVKEFICFFIQHNLEPFTLPSLAINFFLKTTKLTKTATLLKVQKTGIQSSSLLGSG